MPLRIRLRSFKPIYGLPVISYFFARMVSCLKQEKQTGDPTRIPVLRSNATKDLVLPKISYLEKPKCL